MPRSETTLFGPTSTPRLRGHVQALGDVDLRGSQARGYVQLHANIAHWPMQDCNSVHKRPTFQGLSTQSSHGNTNKGRTLAAYGRSGAQEPIKLCRRWRSTSAKSAGVGRYASKLRPGHRKRGSSRCMGTCRDCRYLIGEDPVAWSVPRRSMHIPSTSPSTLPHLRTRETRCF
jgi:hypothetical protein